MVNFNFNRISLAAVENKLKGGKKTWRNINPRKMVVAQRRVVPVQMTRNVYTFSLHFKTSM